MDDLFGGFDRYHPVIVRSPAVDVYEDGKNVLVRVEVPGMESKDIHLTVEDHHMTLKGEKKTEKKEKQKNGRFTESFFGSFSRTFRLPETIETKKIKARLKNGILEITLPKRPETKPKEIPIEMN
ncbi:MAG: Hsp20 family protein [Proteobacteria bacterium]|nr:Hsp20 family protein [Pseudomonadota bacterium]